MGNNLRTLFLSVMILLFCSAAYGADYVENEVIVLTRDSNMTGSALSAAAREGSAAKAAALTEKLSSADRWQRTGHRPSIFADEDGGRIDFVAQGEPRRDRRNEKLQDEGAWQNAG